tara:strand:- start:341 stop:661 length:321 start_codon:yes stop_codon:yes gene_type:complete
MSKNKFGKTVKVDSPYAIYKNDRTNFEHRVLKTYQSKDKESKNEYARWYVASRSPYTYGSWEYGDIYVKDVISYHELIASTDEWKKEYEFIDKVKKSVNFNYNDII